MAVVVVIGAACVVVACDAGGSRELILGQAPTGPGTVTLTAPTPQTPINDVQTDSLRPTLTVTNGSSSAAGTRTYEFQISDRSDFSGTPAATQAGIAEGAGGTTSYTPAIDLAPATRMYWRARVSQSGTSSAWSASGQFRTKIVGFNRAGELYDPLIHGETLGTRSGNTTFMGQRGLRVDDSSSWVRYQLAATLTSGVISVEVEGLRPNVSQEKARIFSMSDATPILFNSKFLYNVQYRGIPGNPNNAISYKVLMGDSDLKYEPDFAQRSDGVRALDPATTYHWQATWGSSFSLTIREGGPTGTIIYQRSQSTPGTYNPPQHFAYLGATDAGFETGSYPGAIYKNFWVGSAARPASLGSALSNK
ncbi:MAG: hypothetical protein FJW21_05480 [Acidimicrobiia bacterium]|nr:hypothetical protein [Acidimicrobiia bacterium]